MDAMMAPDAEVMVSGRGMDTHGMMNAGMDQVMPVNHHLEVHVPQNDTGAVVNNVTPIFRVTDKLIGQSRDSPQVMAMYGVQAGPNDFHYGQNVYLPNSTYQVARRSAPTPRCSATSW
jgi:hypothetical protein